MKFAPLLVLLCPLFAWSQSKVTLDTRSPLRLHYSSPSWNKNSGEKDNASILIRDSITGKVANVEMGETEVNSGDFVGDFSISFGGSSVQPEIYVIPQELMKNIEGLKRAQALIKEGAVLRKPIFLQKGEGRQNVTVYDTKEQATAALDNYLRAQKIGKTNVNVSALEAQARAEEIRAEQERLKNNIRAESERQKIEALEKKKQDDLRKQNESLALAEKQKRQAQARALANDAMALYRQEKYSEAEKLFSQAVELDPTNSAFYYQYGVTLYKLENYNKSVVILRLAQGPEVNETEKRYYVGMNLLKLREFENAVTEFDAVQAANNESLSPSAAFFKGVIRFQKEDYETAKKDFEYVLDNSKDPRLDQQAETYIEQIANVMAFEKEKKKKWILTLNGGLIHDSNILIVSNSQIDDGTPSDLGGYRWIYGGSIEYRPVYSLQHELSVVLSLNDMYSTDTNFKAKKTFQDTDPLSMSVSVPYKYKGLLFSKPFQLGITPGYEAIQMNADSTGGRENIINSTYLKLDQTFVMRESWFATYLLEVRQDQSKLDAADSDDASASKMSLGTVQTFFQNAKKNEAWMVDLTLAQNTAKGENQTYFRYDLGASYMAPWKWETSWTARLAMYNANYSKHLIGRKDDNTSLSLGLQKSFSETLSGMLSGTYSINKSTLESSDYNKYMIMTVFTWRFGL